MLGSASPATASVQTAITSATPTSPTRPSRLRGLSYLRNYTHQHLQSISSRSDAPPLIRSTSSPSEHTLHRSDTSPERRLDISPIQSGENGWIPTIQGRSGLRRDSLHPTSTSTESVESDTVGMTRNRTATGTLGPVPTSGLPGLHQGTVGDEAPRSARAVMSESTPTPAPSREQQATIRFIPHVETRSSSRPSLNFTAVSRTLKTPHSVVRVGRYSERDNLTGDPNTLPVGFKSKVVSRRHCEFWCNDGQWYVKDVKSSSGTFLNHVRLSAPNAESRPYPVNDGDVVQLGIDFKGGEEVIFRCVKIRVECNRGWQKALNTFNTSAHKKLLKAARVGATRDSDAASVNSSECSICLNPVAPCQALFVAPCSHVWHYKCIRNLIQGPSWPNFLCPNCRAVADLEADVEQPEDANFALDDQSTDESSTQRLEHHSSAGSSNEHVNTNHNTSNGEILIPQEQYLDARRRLDEVNDMLEQISIHTRSPPTVERSRSQTQLPNTTASTTPAQPIAIVPPSPSHQDDSFAPRSATPTSTTQFALAAAPIVDGLMTPRNNAGPFVFDGSIDSGEDDDRANSRDG